MTGKGARAIEVDPKAEVEVVLGKADDPNPSDPKALAKGELELVEVAAATATPVLAVTPSPKARPTRVGSKSGGSSPRTRSSSIPPASSPSLSSASLLPLDISLNLEEAGANPDLANADVVAVVVVAFAVDVPNIDVVVVFEDPNVPPPPNGEAVVELAENPPNPIGADPPLKLPNADVGTGFDGTTAGAVVAGEDLKLNPDVTATDPKANFAPKAETAAEPNPPNPPEVTDTAGRLACVPVGPKGELPKAGAPKADAPNAGAPNADGAVGVIAGCGDAVEAGAVKGELPKPGAPNGDEPNAGAPNGVGEGTTAEGVANAGAPNADGDLLTVGDEKAEKAEGAAKVEEEPNAVGTRVDVIVGNIDVPASSSWVITSLLFTIPSYTTSTPFCCRMIRHATKIPSLVYDINPGVG
jgi:hypothetical protein